MVPYVDAVVAVTVMCLMLFVLHVCMLRGRDGERVTEILVWGMDVCGTRGLAQLTCCV